MKKIFLVLFFFPAISQAGMYASTQTARAFPQAGDAYLYPVHSLTPGATEPALTKEVICSPTFRTGPWRNVPLSEKKKVFAEYNIPWSEHSKYEVDHFRSLEISGNNSLENLWPQPYVAIVNGENLGARQKDVVENVLHKELCADQITNEEINDILWNWVDCYHTVKKGGVCHGIKK